MFNPDILIEEFISSNHLPQYMTTDHIVLEHFKDNALCALSGIMGTDYAASLSNFDAVMVAAPILKAIRDSWVNGYDHAGAKSYDEGYSAGREDGYREGWDEGRGEGYEEGYSDAMN